MALDYQTAFNKKIQTIVRENPVGTSAMALSKISKYFPNQKNYYNLLDDVGFTLGIGFGALTVFKGNSDKILGHDPVLKFYPDNVFRENPGATKSLLYQFEKPLNLNESYARLAKELIYKISGIPDLDHVLQVRIGR